MQDTPRAVTLDGERREIMEMCGFTPYCFIMACLLAWLCPAVLGLAPSRSGGGRELCV